MTGGAGFIGSHLVERLIRDGYRVAIVDDFSTGRSANLDESRRLGLDDGLVFRMDVVEADLTAVLRGVRADTIVHLAAQGQVPTSMRRPLRDLSVNVVGSVRVLEAAHACDVRRVVLASSGGTIYGAGSRAHGATNEADPRRPESFYGLSKGTVDEYARLYRQHKGADNISLALGNVYGPRQDPLGEAGVLAIFAHRLVTAQECEVTGDGSATRDYVHVSDVVEAFVRALDRGRGVVNIGTGVGTSVLELYRLLAERVPDARPPAFLPRRPGEVDRIVLDPSRARRELGWQPIVRLADGATDLLTWLTGQGRSGAVTSAGLP